MVLPCGAICETNIKKLGANKTEIKNASSVLLLWVWQEGSEADSSYSQLEAKASWVQVLAEALWDAGIWLFYHPRQKVSWGRVPVIQWAAIQSEQQVDGFDPALEELTDCDQGGSRWLEDNFALTYETCTKL